MSESDVAGAYIAGQAAAAALLEHLGTTLGSGDELYQSLISLLDATRSPEGHAHLRGYCRAVQKHVEGSL